MSSSRKRSAHTSSTTPAASKPRVDAGEGVTPATAARPHGRVVLNVGGQRFESSRSTLEGSSSYFQSLLARWDEETDDALFIDCDADAFGVLLSHMRIASNLILPDDDHKLCARVLLLAEYLGMQGLLAKVKARAYKNMHPGAEEAGGTDPVAAFDSEVGTLQEAIDSKVLPARFFAPVSEPPERVVKTLIPAPPGYRAMFTDGSFANHQAIDEDGDQVREDVRDVLSFAVVQLRDGSTRMEAVVQRPMDLVSSVSFPIHHEYAHPQLQNHLEFASEVRDVEAGHVWKHHLIIPPVASANRLPVAPGTIRAVWAKPAVTRSDVGKRVTVTENGALILDGEVRSVTWGDRSDLPSLKDAKIERVLDSFQGLVQRSQFRVTGYKWHHVPYLTGSVNQTTKDVAFVEMGHGEASSVPARFYIADSRGPKFDVYDTNRLVDVTHVKMHDGMEFSHTITAN